MNVGYTLGWNKADLDYLKDYNLGCVQLTCAFSDDGSKFSSHNLDNVINLVNKGCKIVVHAPLNLSICSDREQVRQWSWKTINSLLNKCSELGFSYLVVHGGRSLQESQMKIDIINNIKIINRVYKGSCKLVLENLTGTKAGYNTGSANFVASIVKELNLPWVGMCWDTNHHFGNPNDINLIEFAEQNKDIIDVVHLNSIPKGTKRGGCQDRHSNVLIEDCEGGPEDLLRVHKLLINSVQILERKELELMERDLRFLSTL